MQRMIGKTCNVCAGSRSGSFNWMHERDLTGVGGVVEGNYLLRTTIYVDIPITPLGNRSL